MEKQWKRVRPMGFWNRLFDWECESVSEDGVRMFVSGSGQNRIDGHTLVRVPRVQEHFRAMNRIVKNAQARQRQNT